VQAPLDPETAPRPKIKDLEVMVGEVVRETPEAATLVLFTGNDRLDYRPGHFLTLEPQQFRALERFIAYFEDCKGTKEQARAYSLSSAPHERSLAITIKEERYVPGITRRCCRLFSSGTRYPGRGWSSPGSAGPTFCLMTSSPARTTWSTCAPGRASYRT